MTQNKTTEQIVARAKLVKETKIMVAGGIVALTLFVVSQTYVFAVALVVVGLLVIKNNWKRAVTSNQI